MGKLPDFEYLVGKWLKYDRSGYNSSHPYLGPPWDLGNPWRPLATMPENGQNGQFVISWSITLEIELWAPYTHWQTVLKGQVILRQKAKFEPDYCPGPYSRVVAVSVPFPEVPIRKGTENGLPCTGISISKMTIFRHGRQGSPRVAKGFQGPRGTPGMGEMSYNQINHI